MIVHRSEGSLQLCYLAHHDDAYRWAESRKTDRHPPTGAAKIVELRETVRKVVVPRIVEAPLAAPEAPKKLFATVAAESAAIAAWLRARIGEGYAPQEIGVFVRSEAELECATAAVRAAGLRPLELDRQRGGQASGAAGAVAVGTMHLAKGLEFRAVVVAACDDEVLPLPSRIENVTGEADLEDVNDIERHLLHVACTRARDRLLVTGVEPASEFLEDLGESRGGGGLR